jgi:hypothetical protein
MLLPVTTLVPVCTHPHDSGHCNSSTATARARTAPDFQHAWACARRRCGAQRPRLGAWSAKGRVGPADLCRIDPTCPALRPPHCRINADQRPSCCEPAVRSASPHRAASESALAPPPRRRRSFLGGSEELGTARARRAGALRIGAALRVGGPPPQHSGAKAASFPGAAAQAPPRQTAQAGPASALPAPPGLCPATSRVPFDPLAPHCPRPCQARPAGSYLARPARHPSTSLATLRHAPRTPLATHVTAD